MPAGRAAASLAVMTTGYYDGPDLVDGIRGALARGGLDPDRLDPADLAALDQFHAQGLAATLALAELAGVRRGERVLDLGAGIAGPARLLAGRGARVTAVEPTARFRRLAASLNAATGTEMEIVAAEGADLPFPAGAFDLVWTQAVLQNVADLEPLAAEVHRVLAPGGRWALAELATGPGGGALRFPVPWGDSDADSHLRPPGVLRDALLRPGFVAEVWRVGPDALPGNGGSRGTPVVTLADLMPDYAARMAAMAENVAEQRVAPVQALLRKPR
jgi:SAM-dependent methyltransferase